MENQLFKSPKSPPNQPKLESFQLESPSNEFSVWAIKTGKYEYAVKLTYNLGEVEKVFGINVNLPIGMIEGEINKAGVVESKFARAIASEVKKLKKVHPIAKKNDENPDAAKIIAQRTVKKREGQKKLEKIQPTLF